LLLLLVDMRSRPGTPTFGPNRDTNSIDRRFSSPQPSSLGIIQVPTPSYASRNIPLTVLEMQSKRKQSASVANLSAPLQNRSNVRFIINDEQL